MMKYLVTFFFFSLILGTINKNALAVPGPRPQDPQFIIQHLIAEKQETKMWCWAASTRMLLSSKTHNLPTQCEMASTMFNTDCCANPKAIKCVRGQNALKVLHKLGFDAVDTTAKVNPAEHWSRKVDYKGWYQSVVDSIKKGSPIIISRYIRAGSMDDSSHAVVAYGTYNQNGKDFLIVFDPLEGISKFWDFSFVTGHMAWIVTTSLK